MERGVVISQLPSELFLRSYESTDQTIFLATRLGSKAGPGAKTKARAAICRLCHGPYPCRPCPCPCPCPCLRPSQTTRAEEVQTPQPKAKTTLQAKAKTKAVEGPSAVVAEGQEATAPQGADSATKPLIIRNQLHYCDPEFVS